MIWVETLDQTVIFFTLQNQGTLISSFDMGANFRVLKRCFVTSFSIK